MAKVTNVRPWPVLLDGRRVEPGDVVDVPKQQADLLCAQPENWRPAATRKSDEGDD